MGLSLKFRNPVLRRSLERVLTATEIAKVLGASFHKLDVKPMLKYIFYSWIGLAQHMTLHASNRPLCLMH
jgi:hypothetical protein